MSISSGPWRFLLGFFLSAGVLLGIVASINYTIDPLWIWGSKNRFNVRAIPVDIRIQKVNRLMQPREGSFSTVLLGSSRTANYELHPSGDSLNFAMHSMLAPEFLDALQTTERVNKQPFQRVYVGLEFATSSGQYISIYPKFSRNLERASASGYKLKATIGWSSLLDSLATVRNSLALGDSGCMPCYDHAYHFHLPDLQGRDWELGADNQIGRMRERMQRYWLAPTYWTEMGSFARAAAGRSVAFLTPEHLRLHYLIHRERLDTEYADFVRNAVMTFGQVIVFDPQAPVWRSDTTFYDLHHPRPQASRMLVQCIQSEGQNCAPSLAATVLTRSNVGEFLEDWELGMANWAAKCRSGISCDPFDAGGSEG